MDTPYTDFEIRLTRAFISALSKADRQETRNNAVNRRDGFQQIIDIIDAVNAAEPVENGYLASLGNTNTNKGA